MSIVESKVRNKENGHKTQVVSMATERRKGFYEKYIKRPQDFICALAALIVLSPVMLITALIVRIKLGSPVLFIQPRPGLNEKIIYLKKFRSMTSETDENGKLLPDEARLTKFGKALRATSLDELPELINILKGDMAVIGPRPQLVRDMMFMTDEQRQRHSVRPGLSGLAQVNGRNCIEWEDKLAYDLKYVDSITFLGDWKIIFQTVLKVFKSESISYEGMATAEDFGDYLLRTGKVEQEEYRKCMKMAEDILKG